MDNNYNNYEPIYLQIIRRICYQIFRGEYKPGDKLPSWIDAGLAFDVNHNTIARVYQELALLGIIETRRGEGSFVTDNQSRIDELHDNMRDDLISNMVMEMTQMGYSLDNINQAFNNYIDSISEVSHY